MTSGHPHERISGVSEAEELLLQQVLGSWDPVPRGEIERAQALFALRSLDIELAEMADGELATTDRSGADLDSITFASAAGRLDVEVHQMGRTRVRLVGQFAPSDRPADLAVGQGLGVEWSAPVDRLGRFIVEVDRGPVRIQLRSGSEALLTTGGFLV